MNEASLFPPEEILKVSCVDVAVPLPVDNVFSYKVSAELTPKIKTGVRIRVPFRNREITGYIVGQRTIPDDPKLKFALDILDSESVLSKNILELTKWISEYYASSWGEAIENALPKWVKYGKKAEKALAKEIPQEVSDSASKEDLRLSPDQQKAITEIRAQIKEKSPKPILLFGVTGSGKSELYIRTIREVLAAGKSAICLVPEIALTEQLRLFFYHHFGNQLEILHSKLSDGERFLAWKRLERGEKNVVLGPRSAVFAPLPKLGLIIMDEEHEGTYKQETTPRYHAREVAMWRAKNEGVLFAMGTATPSLETMKLTESKQVIRIDLQTRIDDKAMPAVQILDLKDASNNAKRAVILTPKLLTEIEINLQKKEGTLLLLNRRGFSTHIHCQRCSQVENCQSCHVSMTFHQEDGVLLCHYCNYQKPVPEECSNCKAPLLRFAGFGTEKVESEVAAKFPQARIARMDADSVRKKGSHEVILKEFRDRKIDILIGTQMIAKGFDFPHVTLVGVVLADVGLSLPDFRSAERTFQLLTQVAGRAGRGKLPGRVLIQTYSPNHPSVQHAKNHDYLSFYQHEINERYQYKYPPYSRLINFIIRGKDEKKSYLFARSVRDALKEKTGSEAWAGVEITGPAPLPFYKLRGNFRWHVMIKTPLEVNITKDILSCLSAVKKSAGVAMAIDVDPLNIL